LRAGAFAVRFAPALVADFAVACPEDSPGVAGRRRRLRLAGCGALRVGDAGRYLLLSVGKAVLLLELVLQFFVLALALAMGTGRHGSLLEDVRSSGKLRA
jgi:hypothetical protein